MNVNKNHKDTVFSSLFNNPDVLRELYCALEGTDLPDTTPVIINTLSGVLYMNLVNDVSFEIGGRLVVLIEHQSTINQNMAIRLLLYIARVYEQIIQGKMIYSTKRILIPRPEFFVLYNGLEPYPDEAVLKLSDLYESVETLGIEAAVPVALELTVKVININEGRNEKIAKRSRTLSEYSAFIGKVREFEKGGESKEEAITKAAVYCRNHDILKEFLERHASEVINMLMTEWNMEDALAVRYEEGIEAGKEDGKEEEKIIIAKNLLSAGSSYDFINKITGLDADTIIKISAEM